MDIQSLKFVQKVMQNNILVTMGKTRQILCQF